MLEGFRTNEASFGRPSQQPIFQGVDALFTDFGARQLDLDFAADDFLLGGGAAFGSPQQEAWHRNAALTNIAAQGAAVRSLGPTGFDTGPQGAWKAWSPSDDRMEQSSGDSWPSTSHQQPSSTSPWQQPQPQPEVKAEVAETPQLSPPAKSRVSAKQAAQQEREREKAEKLKEKNKRAQRKFRQRQKDRQESAEKMAMDLAEQLQKMQLEKEALENRNRMLEQALGNAPPSPSPSQPAESQEPEPTFTPAHGWNVFNPTGGMVLVAICSPPRRFTHRQMLSLSLRDMSTIMNELMRLLKECLDDLERLSPNPTAEARIKGLLAERHAIMAYLAVSSPKMLYQVLTSKMVDPPEPNCSAPPAALWARVLKSINMTEEQKRNVMDAREVFMKKIGKFLLERHEVMKQLQEMEIIPSAGQPIHVASLHLKWSELANRLKANIDYCHRCHSYYMSRVWYRDCFSPPQVARFLIEAHPYPVDIFSIIRELAAQLGCPSYMDLLRKYCGEDRVNQAIGPSDPVLELWPTTFLNQEGAANFKRQQAQDEQEGDPEVAKIIAKVPDHELVDQLTS